MMETTDISIPDLPDWMRQARRGIDWGLLLTIALCLIAGWSFLFNPELPHTNASENYVYRTDDYATSILEGWLYPRWSPNALGGYGAPIPHYYPPGATYFAAILHVLFTGEAVVAVRLAYIIGLVIAGVFTYSLVAQRTGSTAGVLAAMLYVYSPYVGLVVPHVLGDLPGLIALALLPVLLWSLDRLLMWNHPADVLFVTLTSASLWLTHPPAMVMGLFLCAALIIWNRQFDKRHIRWHLLIIGLLLGVGCAGFYWIPAWLEQGDIQWQTVTVISLPKLSLNELFTPLQQLDTNEMVASPQFTLGIISLVFAIGSVGYMLRYHLKINFQIFFLVFGAVLTLFAVLIFPTEIWLLGVVMLCLAIGGSQIMAIRFHLPRRWRRLVLPALMIVIWISASPVWLVPQATEAFGGTDAAVQVQYEQRGYGVAVLPQGMLLPSSLRENIPLNRFLIDSFQSRSINKLAPGQVTPNVQISPLIHFTHGDRFLLRRVATPATLHILTSYFSGWTASINSRPVPLSQDPATGLMVADVPINLTGNAELLIAMDTTPLRTGAWLVAGASLLITVIISWGRWGQKTIIAETKLLTVAEVRLAVVPVACFVVILLVFTQPQFPLSLRTRPGSGLNGSVIIQNRTDVGLGMTGFRLDSNQHHPGETVYLTLYWQAQRFLTENYRVQVNLINNRDGQIGAEVPLRHPGYYPTSRWNTRQYVTDRYMLELSPSITAGNYQIAVTVYNTANQPLTFFDATGQTLGTTLTLPTLVSINP